MVVSRNMRSVQRKQKRQKCLKVRRKRMLSAKILWEKHVAMLRILNTLTPQQMVTSKTHFDDSAFNEAFEEAYAEGQEEGHMVDEWDANAHDQSTFDLSY